MVEKRIDEKKEYVTLSPTRPQPSEEDIQLAEDALTRDKKKLAMEKEAEKNRPPLTETEKEVIRRREAKAKLVKEAEVRLASEE